jgi:hypothetical protein
LNKKTYIPVLLAVLSVNTLGILLRLLELPSYIIIMGFRFHLSLVVPFFFIANKLKISSIKKEFTDPCFKKNYPFLISVIIIPLVVFLAVYFIKYITLADPEYFYEFGLSSVVDFPVYLIWNSIQLIMFYFFIIYLIERVHHSFFFLFSIIILLFAYELIPLTGEEVNITGIADLLITSLLLTLLFIRYRNIYWIVLFSFFMLWIFILLFGTSYLPVIHLIFAAQYFRWEGFFEVNSSYEQYFYVIYVSLLLAALFLLSAKKKS